MNHREIAQAAARKLYNEMSSCLMLSDREFDAVEAKIAAIIQKEMAEHFCALEIERLLAAGGKLLAALTMMVKASWFKRGQPDKHTFEQYPDIIKARAANRAWDAVAGKENKP